MQKKITSILKKVKIDDLVPGASNSNLIELEAISKISVKDKKSVSFAIDIGFLAVSPEVGMAVKKRCEDQINSAINLDKLTIIITSSEKPQKPNVNKPAQTSENKSINSDIKQIAGVKNVITIASGKGGVGKSTVSVNLALSLKRLGYKVALVDADIYGPSITHMMNLQGEPESEDGLMVPIENYGISCISIASLIKGNKALAWRGPMITKTLHQLIHGTKWKDIDYMVIDMPPGTGDIHLSMMQKFPIKGGVIVSTPQDVAVIDALRSVDMFKKLNIPILGVVQNMAYLINESDQKKIYLFGKDGAKKMAKDCGVGFLGEIPLNSTIRQSGDDKNPIVNLNSNSELSIIYGMIAENMIDNKK